MSATVNDDSVFSEVLDIKKEDLQDVIVPKYINDIGDRLILAPQLLNTNITDESIINEIKTISNEYNTVVIVPSYERAKIWDPSGKSIIDKNNIEQAIQDLKNGNEKIKILVNRYDGIDLPGAACRVLVIDGLPNFEHEYDKYLKSINPNSDYLLRSRMSKIEQGMGRGVRSTSDYCCIFLMGSQLLSIFKQSKVENYFSKAIYKQYQLSKVMWDGLLEDKKIVTLSDIIELKKYCLGNDEASEQWKKVSREYIMDLEYDKDSHIDSVKMLLREAYNSAKIGDFDSALKLYEKAKKEEVNDSNRRGYIMQLKSMVENVQNKLQAQETLKAAREINNSLLKPIDGIIYMRKNKKSIQEKNIYDYVSKITNENIVLCKICDILGKLSFSSDSDDFEHALFELGNFLGFDSRRPDKEDPGNGPDNIWISDNKILVFECKNESDTDISKRDCDQLSGEINWSNKEYGEYKSYPIIVHKTNIVDRIASPPNDMHVLTEKDLIELKEQINCFVEELFNRKEEINNEIIKSLLNNYYLREENFVNKYTSKYQQKK